MYDIVHLGLSHNLWWCQLAYMRTLASGTLFSRFRLYLTISTTAQLVTFGPPIVTTNDHPLLDYIPCPWSIWAWTPLLLNNVWTTVHITRQDSTLIDVYACPCEHMHACTDRQNLILLSLIQSCIQNLSCTCFQILHGGHYFQHFCLQLSATLAGGRFWSRFLVFSYNPHSYEILQFWQT